MPSVLAGFHLAAVHELQEQDPQLLGLLEDELRRQSDTLAMIASSSIAAPSVLACAGSALGNVTAEGYPGARYHAGCLVADEVEALAIERARAAFAARYANVQPHSGSSANLAVLMALMQPGQTLMGLDLDAGGHLTHGSSASVTGRLYRSVTYGVGPDGLIDLDEVAMVARAERPRVIFCGASSYPRAIDFAGFRRIADEVGAWLVADISHIAGLVAAGRHPSPIDVAHVTTTSTYKQLYGPRGGLILSGVDAAGPGPDQRGTLAATLQRAIFPRAQGTPDLAGVAAKARALQLVSTPAFGDLMARVLACASTLAQELNLRGLPLLTEGTDNHLVVIDVGAKGYTGVVVEGALEECGITVNKNRIPGDQKSALITSGIRLGTNCLAGRGMGSAEMVLCADLLIRVIAAIQPLDDVNYRLDPQVRAEVRAEVAELCRRFPLPGYPG